MNETDLKLKGETEKWLLRIEPILYKVKPINSEGSELLKNMLAYVSDSKHFLDKKDFIRAFEAIVWAWAIYELGKELGIFKTS